jgi:phosphoribosylformylglycinamidine cyclo-ligase
VIDTNSWQWPDVFKWLQENGNVKTSEMFRTFNCGVGMIIALPEDKADSAIALLNAEGEQSWLIGEVQARAENEDRVEFLGNRA